MIGIGITQLIGALGGAIDILLHALQLSDKPRVGRKAVAWITLLSCVLMGLSLFPPHFNLGAALIEVFCAGMSIRALMQKDSTS